MNALIYAVLGCMVAGVVVSDNWQEDDGQALEVAKRSLGDLCRCCTTKFEPWCCRACLHQIRSPTPFYSGKRSFPETNSVVETPIKEKRPRYRSRSQCVCCFTRRLRWCCDSCRRNRWYRGKRSSSVQDLFQQDPADLYLDPEIDDTGSLSTLPAVMESYEPISPLSKQERILDVPAFPLESARKDCLCCFLYDAVSCCDRCKNAA